MKNKTKIYAEALSEIALKIKPENDKKIADNFLRIIKKNSDDKKIKEIIFRAEELFFKKNGNKRIIIEVARKIDLKNLINVLADKGDVVREEINSDLFAGVKITIDGERQLDFSLKNKLDSIF